MNDLGFLLFALIASVVGIVIVLVRNRRPSSTEASIDEFRRGLQALAPDEKRRSDAAREE